MFTRYAVFAAFVLATAAAAPAPPASVFDLTHHSVNPLADTGKVRIIVFARSDCPITRRYAPELHRLAQEFSAMPVEFWMVFPDTAETATDVRSMLSEYSFPGKPVLDPKHELVRIAHVTVAPEAAVFDLTGKLLYHGRIDDLYVDIGKSRAAPTTHDLEDAISAALAGRPVRQAETSAVGCSLADVE